MHALSKYPFLLFKERHVTEDFVTLLQGLGRSTRVVRGEGSLQVNGCVHNLADSLLWDMLRSDVDSCGGNNVSGSFLPLDSHQTVHSPQAV